LAFIETIHTKLWAGHTAFLLQFNTNDRYFDAENGDLPPDTSGQALPLRLAITAAFSCHDVGYYSQSTGMMPLHRPEEEEQSVFATGDANETPVEAITRGIQTVRGDERRILIIDFTSFLIPNGTSDMLHPDTTRMVENLVRVAQDDELRKLNSFLIGICYSREIHDLVRRNWCIIDLPLPVEADRQAYYELLVGGDHFAPLEAGIGFPEFLSLSRGCRLRDIENVMRQAYAEGRRVARDDFNAVREATLNALVGDHLVVRQPSGLTFNEIAGMDALRHFISSIATVVKAGKHGLAPGGILLQGPPGTGKTFVVDAIAATFGYTILEWRSMKSMWLGQSEANLDTALGAIEAMNPVVVLIDEADQVLSGRQEGHAGDGGTGGYMFGRLLNFMGDGRLKGRVVWVLCSNRPDLIDPALADRIGCCVPLLRPVKKDIPRILISLAEQIHVTLDLPERRLIEIIRALPKQVSIRKLKDLVGLAALHSGDDHIGPDELMAALSNVLFNEDQMKIDYWTLLAVRMATYATLLPWRNGVEVIPENIPQCLNEIVSPTTGDIEAGALDQKIFELSRMVGA
jgi:ATP-dependent 26S proteasome regulatory subunit